MPQLDFMLHDAAGHIGDTLAMVMRTLRQVGAFDGEAGDEIFGGLSLARAAAENLRDNLDPAFVSIVPLPPSGRAAEAKGCNVVDLHPGATGTR